MTQEDINDLMIKNMPLWQEKQLYAQSNNKELLDRIIKQVVKEEREACALVCDKEKERYGLCGYLEVEECAEAIRARGNE